MENRFLLLTIILFAVFCVFISCTHFVQAAAIYDNGTRVGRTAPYSIFASCTTPVGTNTCGETCRAQAGYPQGTYNYSDYTCQVFSTTNGTIHMGQPDDEGSISYHDFYYGYWGCGCDCQPGVESANNCAADPLFHGVNSTIPIIDPSYTLYIFAKNDCEGNGTGIWGYNGGWVYSSDAETCCVSGYKPVGKGECVKEVTCRINSFTNVSYDGDNKSTIAWNVSGVSTVDISGIGSNLPNIGTASNVPPGTYTLTASGCSDSPSLTIGKISLNAKVVVKDLDSGKEYVAEKTGTTGSDITDALLPAGHKYQVTYSSFNKPGDDVKFSHDLGTYDSYKTSGTYSLTTSKTTFLAQNKPKNLFERLANWLGINKLFAAATDAVTATVNVTVAPPCSGSISANPNPIEICLPDTLGVTTLTANNVTCNFQIRVGSPTGTLMTSASEPPGTRNYTTGDWVSDGMWFYLVESDKTDGSYLDKVQITHDVYESLSASVNCPSSATAGSDFVCSLSVTGGKTPYSCDWLVPGDCTISVIMEFAAVFLLRM